jgi:hypothetical protein
MKKTAAAAVALAMFSLGLLTVVPDASARRCSPDYKTMSRSNLQSLRHDMTPGEHGQQPLPRQVLL